MADSSEISRKLEDITDWFPPQIVRWIRLHSIRLGVPDTYMAIPLIVTVAYLSQHSSCTYRIKLDEEPVADQINPDESFDESPETLMSHGTPSSSTTSSPASCEAEELNGKDEEMFMEFQSEPLVLYGVICGESGSNKSACLNVFSKLVDKIPNYNGPKVEHTLDTFTLDGLMSAMLKNNECAIGLFDEMSTFDDSLDKGSNKSFDRSRFLTLFGAGKWKKSTMTSGERVLTDPRFNMASFTQPHYLHQFADNNAKNGFFARFLVSLPEERFIEIDEKIKFIRQQARDGNAINMAEIFKSIYDRCVKKGIELFVSDDGSHIYKDLHDEIVQYRREHRGFKLEKSIRSKSLGILLRVGGVMSFIRNALCNTDEEVTFYDNEVNLDDMERALKIVKYCQKNSLAVCDGKVHSVPQVEIEQKISRPNQSRSRLLKVPMPAPENFTFDYVMDSNPTKVKNLLSVPQVKIRNVTGNKMYPSVPDTDTRDGAQIARNWLQGLVVLGLGEVDKASKVFKRFHPDDPNCHDREGLRKIWNSLNITSEFEQENDI